MTDVNKLKDWLQWVIASCEAEQKKSGMMPFDGFHRPRMVAMRIALASLNNVCMWKYRDKEYNWATGCGEKFQFTDGSPEDNKTRFCPCCGRPVVVLKPGEYL